MPFPLALIDAGVLKLEEKSCLIGAIRSVVLCGMGAG